MRYGLQLTAAHGEEAVRAFIEHHGLSGRAIYFRSWHEGRPWFCVLYGTFPDEAAARAARDRLPAGLRPEETWGALVTKRPARSAQAVKSSPQRWPRLPAHSA